MITYLSSFVSEYLPNVVIHGLEEELVVWSIQLSFEVGQCNLPGALADFHEVGRLLFVYIVDDLGFLHGGQDRTGNSQDSFLLLGVCLAFVSQCGESVTALCV